MNELITIVDDKPILESGMVLDLIEVQNKMKELKTI